MSWNKKVAVITGGASGIGQAIARNLIEQGCHLALVDVNQTALEQTRKSFVRFPRHVSIHQVDVTNESQMQALPEAILQEHDQIDVLFNNAGITIDKPFEAHSLKEWELIIGINLWGVIYGCKFFLPYLQQRDEAFIVNTSSLAGFLGIPTQSSYCATKAAVRAISESLYAEFKGKNIHVTSVHPGAIRTNLFKKAIEMSDDPDAAKKMFDAIEKVAMDPNKAAAKIVKAAMKKKQRVIVGIDARLIEIAKRLMPSLIHRLFEWGFRLKKG